ARYLSRCRVPRCPRKTVHRRHEDGPVEVVARWLMPSEQPVRRRTEDASQSREEHDVGRVLSPSPFRAGLRTDLQHLRDVELREPLHFTPLTQSLPEILEEHV